MSQNATSARCSRFSFISRRALTSASAIFLLAATVCSGSAQVLLTINDSDPAAVVITATGADPALNYTGGNTANIGVELLQFFTLDEFNMTFGQFLTGTLTGGNIGVNYNDVYSDNQSTAGGNYLDMELYVDVSSPGQGNAETFSTSQSAFTGTWTIDMTALGVTSAALPAAGTTGTINTGITGSPGANIGQWQVQAVPEPATASLAIVGSLVTGMTVLRRRHSGGN